MRTIDISDIIIGKRQRSVMDATALNELKSTITSDGLIHPILLTSKDDGLHLVAGERRTKAVSLLHEEGVEIRHDTSIIPYGMIPYTLTSELSASELLRLEFYENDSREALSWQDRAQALVAIHEAKVAANPKQTKMDTARELVADGTTDMHPVRVSQAIQEAIVVTRNLSNPTIAKARNQREAVKLSVAAETRDYEAELIRRGLAKKSSDLNLTLRHGDCQVIMPNLDEGFVDLILTDPPYGINAGRSGFRERTVHHHNYEDTPDLAKAIMKAILVEGFRICKPEANLLMFGDVDLFPYFKEVASQMGWTPWRRPLIWRKSNEGLAPWGAHGPRYTYDMIFYAKKGQRGMLSTPLDVFDDKRVPKQEREYAAQKPVELLEKLIDHCTLPGDFIFDPCMGSGSTLVAARKLKRHGLGIEIDKDAYNLATTRVYAPEEEAETPPDEDLSSVDV